MNEWMAAAIFIGFWIVVILVFKTLMDALS